MLFAKVNVETHEAGGMKVVNMGPRLYEEIFAGSVIKGVDDEDDADIANNTQMGESG